MNSRLAFAFFFAAALRAAAAGVDCASADSMAGLMDAWTHDFTALHSETPARVTLRAKFSADAFDALLRGEVQVAPFSRELFPSEHARYRVNFGATPLLVPIATGSRDTKGGTHAIAIFVNESNPLARLTIAQLREILANDGGITTWGQLGLTGEWAEQRISLHGMTVRRETGNPPGIVNFLEQRLLGNRTWRPDLHEHVDVAGGPQALELIVRAVAADKSALGYSGFAYAQPGTKTLALANPGGFCSGTADDVSHRAYPLTRTLYLCLPPAPDAATREFVRYVLGSAGQQAIGKDRERFFPLTDPMLAASRELVAEPTWPDDAPHAVGPVLEAPYLTPAGAIAIVGYNDMREMLAALCEKFAATHPNVTFNLDLKGTRTAPPALAAGRTLFASMGAEFSEQETAGYRAATGHDPIAIRIAHDSLDPRALSGPLAIFVQADNPLTALTMTDLTGIFSGTKPRPGLRPCGLLPTTALGRFMRERALDGANFAPGFTGFPQSADVVHYVAGHRDAIGFAAAMRATPGVRALSLASGGAPVAPTAENLVAGRYPLDRHLLVYLREPIDPLAREFLRLVLSRDGQEIIAGGTLGYLPLSASDAAIERAKLGSP